MFVHKRKISKVWIRKFLILSVTALLLLVLTFAGCGVEDTGSVSDNAHSSQGKEETEKREPLVIRLEGGDWGYCSPFTHYSRGPGSFKMKYVFDSLLERDEEGYIPWLAESWDIEDDGKTYIFNLQQGVKWHNGRDMTAGDVEFSFKYYQEHPPVSYSDILLDKEYLLDVEELSDYRVKFTTAEPNAAFLSEVGTARIIPKHIWEQVEKPQEYLEAEAVVGCGPYRLIEYNKEHGIYRFEAFEEYWGPKPLVDVMEFVPVSDSILAFEKGEIDLTGVTTDLLARFQGNPVFKIMESPGFWGYRIVFNMEKNEIFRSKNFRQAFAHAVDKQELVDKIARGAAIPGNYGILSRHHVWYNPDVTDYEYDPDKARGILEKEKLDKNLSFTLLVGADAEVRIGEIFKEQLSKAGIEIKVESVDGKSRDARIAEGQYQIALVGHGGWGGDPDYLRKRFSSELTDWYSGTPGYVNAEVDRLANEQIKETDTQQRKEMIFELQRLLAEDVPEIPLYNTTGYSVFRPDKFDGWMFMFDHHSLEHSKLSYLKRD
ncbi:MAG: diguanylate phosphodiesterase [Firmicutes bacterium HGW-Firmicutes-13]|nr:MAG: diguanylate phosphodiesterase [Firmicutes bacterium HGW-Firmicutes-13]